MKRGGEFWVSRTFTVTLIDAVFTLSILPAPSRATTFKPKSTCSSSSQVLTKPCLQSVDAPLVVGERGLEYDVAGALSVAAAALLDGEEPAERVSGTQIVLFSKS